MGVSYIEIPISDEDRERIADKQRNDGSSMYFGNYVGALLSEYLRAELPGEVHELVPGIVEMPEAVVFERVIGDEVGVYYGDLTSLQRADVKWNRVAKDELPLTPARYMLSLEDIEEQLADHDHSSIITVFDNTPVHGVIYQYGKHGNNWRNIGRHCGRV